MQFQSEFIRNEVLPRLGGLLQTACAAPETELLSILPRLTELDPQAARLLTQWADEMAALSPGARAELHTQTFELNPACVLYVSVHLFGQESFKRAKLMTGLDEAYHTAGFDRCGELPDHLGVILRFAPRFGSDEWDDLVRLCLLPTTEKMHGALAQSDNPYRRLIEAVAGLIAQEAQREVIHDRA